jgi:hypothetical protein
VVRDIGRNLDEVNPDLELAMATPLVNPEMEGLMDASPEVEGSECHPCPPGVEGSSPLVQRSQEMVRLSPEALFDDSIGDEIATSSQFTLPCAQPSPQPVAVDNMAKSPVGLWNTEQEWNMSGYETPKIDSRNSSDVQLEYDISEADMAIFDQSDTSFVSVLSGVKKEGGARQDFSGESELLLGEEGVNLRGSKQPSLSRAQGEMWACHQNRRRLIRLVLGESDEEGVASGGDSGEEEHIEMSQLVWSDEEVAAISTLRGGQRRAAQDGSIPQLDGDAPPPSVSMATLFSSDTVVTKQKRKRKLGRRKKQKAVSISTPTLQEDTPMATLEAMPTPGETTPTVREITPTLGEDTPIFGEADAMLSSEQVARELGAEGQIDSRDVCPGAKKKRATPTLQDFSGTVCPPGVKEQRGCEATPTVCSPGVKEQRGCEATPTVCSPGVKEQRGHEATPTVCPPGVKEQRGRKATPHTPRPQWPSWSKEAAAWLILEKKVCRTWELASCSEDWCCC